MARVPIDDPSRNETSQSDESDYGSGDSTSSANEGHPDPAEELLRLRTERDSLFDRLARVSADFKNSQKRLEQDMDQRAQYANSSLIKSLLPVLDNFERALAVDPTKVDAAAILKGMQIVHDQWMSMLKQQQVEEIAPTPGTPFDPSRHQALMQQEAVYPVPTVVQLLQKGYALHDRTLRPAQVAVSKSV